jgi:hypothetical protein
VKQIHPPNEAEFAQGCIGPFYALWLCGWVIVEYILIATLFGADMRWQGGNTPPLWSLIIFSVFWTASGLYVAKTLLNLIRERKS